MPADATTSAVAPRRVVVLTGSELRHDFVRMALASAPGIMVALTICEKTAATPRPAGAPEAVHFLRRDRSEEDFFGAFVRLTVDRSNPLPVERGAINDVGVVERVLDTQPELVVAYGCSIVRSVLLERLRGRFVNIHLGLSPYYRGSGTNFWPLVNGEPEFVGATFMHIDGGVDTGRIIHQIRARIHPGDDVHGIGNRLIADVAVVCRELVRRFDDLTEMPQPVRPRFEKIYRRGDFDSVALARLDANFRAGVIDDYLRARDARVRDAPIVSNPLLVDAGVGGRA